MTQVSENWKGAPFIKTLQQRLECPIEDSISTLSSETIVSSSQIQNQSLSSSSPIDIELPGGLSILILTDKDYGGGSILYKRRLARFYRAKNSTGKEKRTWHNKFDVKNLFTIFNYSRGTLLLVPSKFPSFYFN